MLRADQARISYNGDKKRWEVRIQVGGEVVKRPISKGGSDDLLRSQAMEIARDEGYELDPAHVTIDQAPVRAA